MKLNGARYVDEYCFELRRSKQSHQINEYKKAFHQSQLLLIGGEVVGSFNVCPAPVHQASQPSSPPA